MEGTGENKLHWADMLVIALYFVVSMVVGLWVICKPNQNTMKGYFLAGRNMLWWPVGMSIFASNIGADNFVGMSGTAAASGVAVVQFEWAAVFLLVLLGWIFLPVYCGSGIYTMPEYLQKRFGRERLRIYLTIIALANYLFSTLAVDLFTGALFIQQAIGWNLYVGVFVMLSIAVIYCSLGGLATVIFTDAMAVIIMFIGGTALAIVGMLKVGGLEGLYELYMNSVSNYTLEHPNTTCGYPREDALNLFRGFDADFPWLSVMIRTTFGSMWFWCANQLLVQRTLASKDLSNAQGGCIFAAFMKILPIFIIVWPGMMSRALFPNEVGCADADTCMAVCGNPMGCSNIAYPKLVVELMPAGARGLILAVMMAAVVSTLTSLFNSSSTIISMDLWARFRPKAGEREILIVSRVFVLVMTVVAVLWIPVMQQAQGGQIYRYSTTIKGYLGAPTSIMFLLAVLWNRTTEPGAFWGIIVAQVLGGVRFVLDIVYPEPGCGFPDDRPAILRNLNGYDFTAIQVASAFIAIIGISLCTKPQSHDEYSGMTYWTRHEKTAQDRQNSDVEQELKAMTQGNDDAAKMITPPTSNTDPEQQDKCIECMGCRRWWESFTGKGAKNDEIPYEPYSVRMRWMIQKPSHKRILDASAILVVVVTVFLYGFFR